MDTYFISYGSPMLAIEEDMPARSFLKSWPQRIHQNKPNPTVNIVDHNSIIYDFYGFPKPINQLKYPAPGAPRLAKRVKELLSNSGFQRVKEDKNSWARPRLISQCVNFRFRHNSMEVITTQGVLIIGSGSATHNLSSLGKENTPVPSWAEDFDTWLKECLLAGRHEDINHYEEKAPRAKMVHPWPEHFYPLHVALGASGEEAKAELVHHSWREAALSFASYRFKTTPC
ncbi:hypothetical protein MKX01_025594 [Papaver californicum]|nr:hypothetical protein MKX01_025594 [Papaver californicum]